ncbi:uncharacterized protein BO95DRAFT_42465 [Aspergillus brunneoviolaceus CBS 621.78]|uniref:Uncharacterized protein n=1 Tax=Aspergillus brunneoviolaceus CBS 621.78 TaxID=1450534 RepID=A0ACD1GH48_9EURO|nr:hypothetical protein BO95DRAFT_42465 [Aspergillus brunneoviolaceus CBS 621.78]RAH48583.1 hypothetical protein BO95DRAFT_42465 [Aspergillus brunneoviolaceus CBS 621.78]
MTFLRPLTPPHFTCYPLLLSQLAFESFLLSGLSDLQTAAARSLTWSCRPSSTTFFSPCLHLATGDVSGLWRSECICPPAQVYPRAIGYFLSSSLKCNHIIWTANFFFRFSGACYFKNAVLYGAFKPLYSTSFCA